MNKNNYNIKIDNIPYNLLIHFNNINNNIQFLISKNNSIKLEYQQEIYESNYCYNNFIEKDEYFKFENLNQIYNFLLEIFNSKKYEIKNNNNLIISLFIFPEINKKIEIELFIIYFSNYYSTLLKKYNELKIENINLLHQNNLLNSKIKQNFINSQISNEIDLCIKDKKININIIKENLPVNNIININEINIEKEDNINNVFSYDYIMSLKNSFISNETNKLSIDVINHCKILSKHNLIISDYSSISPNIKKNIKESFEEEFLNFEIKKKYLLPIILNVTKNNLKESEVKIIQFVKDHENRKIFLILLFQNMSEEEEINYWNFKLLGDVYNKFYQELEQYETGKNSFKQLITQFSQKIFNDPYTNEIIPIFSANDEKKIKDYFLGNSQFIARIIKNRILPLGVIDHIIKKIMNRILNFNNENFLQLIYYECIFRIYDAYIKIKINFNTNENLKNHKKLCDLIIELIFNFKEDEIFNKNYYKKFEEIKEKMENKERNNDEKYNKIINISEAPNPVNNINENGISINVICNEEAEKNLIQKEINKKLFDDIINFYNFSKENKSIENFNWATINDIYYNHSLLPIIIGFIDSCVYKKIIVDNNKILKTSIIYITENILYYFNDINKNEKINIKNKIFELFVKNTKNIRGIFFDFWASFFNVLITIINIIKVEDFEQLYELNLDDNHIINIFIIIKKMWKLNNKEKEFLKKFRRLNFITKKTNMFEKIIKMKIY